MRSVPWGYRTLAVAVLVVLAGCVLPGFSTTTETPEPTEPSPATTPTASTTPMPDPPEDRIGWEDGYWYNESLALTPEDGYNMSELRAILRRTMARVEVIRQREFLDEVFINVITREQWRERTGGDVPSDPFRDQFYEALFLIGEDTEASKRLHQRRQRVVGGYYSGSSIDIVTNGSDAAQIYTYVVAHELVHALQEDHFDSTAWRVTFDGRMGNRGLLEGEANFVADRYAERCETEWDCIRPLKPPSPDVNRSTVALGRAVVSPYAEGPSFVGALRERGGWAAVDRAHERLPASTEQLIHPEAYPDDQPAEVRVENRSNGDWHRFRKDAIGEERDRVGEAALYAMLWRNGVVPEDNLDSGGRHHSYAHPATTGWEGDAFVPYRNDDRFGYVFVSVWETERDAREFHEAYLALLESRGASQVAETVYVIPEDDPFADAFRVVRRGDRVVVVNAPTVDELDEIHPPSG